MTLIHLLLPPCWVHSPLCFGLPPLYQAETQRLAEEKGEANDSVMASLFGDGQMGGDDFDFAASSSCEHV